MKPQNKRTNPHDLTITQEELITIEKLEGKRGHY